MLNLKACAPVATGILMAACIGAASAADTVVGPIVIVTDTPEDFHALGSLTTTDTDNPPDGMAEWFDIDGTHWDFRIKHDMDLGPPPSPYRRGRGNNRGGFREVGFVVEGGGAVAAAGLKVFHIINPPVAPPPPGAAHAGEASNAMAGQSQPLNQRGNVDFGKAGRRVTFVRRIGHGPNGHSDYISISGRIQALNGPGNILGAPAPRFGPPNFMTGTVRLQAAHRADRRFSFPDYGEISSGPESGTTVAFNAETGLLRFNVGPIDSLTFDAGSTGKIDREFRRDGLLDAKWIVSPMRLLRKEGEGFLFGAGKFSLRDQLGTADVGGSFETFYIEDTTSLRPLRSFAVLGALNIIQDPCGCESFLDGFIEDALFGQGASPERWSAWNGIDLAIVTEENLVELTEGFTASAKDVPARVILVANSTEELF